MVKMEMCESCGNKPAEYVLDDRHICVECYNKEEKEVCPKEKVIPLAVAPIAR